MQMVIGTFAFGLRESGVAYQQLQRSSSARYTEQERVGRRAAHQYLGEGQDQITLNGVIAPEFCGPNAPLNLVLLRKLKKEGKPQQIILYNAMGQIGDVIGKWIILEVQETQSELLGNLPRKIDFTITIKRVDETESELGRQVNALG